MTGESAYHERSTYGRLQGDYLRKATRRGLITLNRPEAMNAISRNLIKELHAALDEIEADPEIRAVVVTGAGAPFPPAWTKGKRLADVVVTCTGPMAFPPDRARRK